MTITSAPAGRADAWAGCRDGDQARRPCRMAGRAATSSMTRVWCPGELDGRERDGTGPRSSVLIGRQSALACASRRRSAPSRMACGGPRKPRWPRKPRASPHWPAAGPCWSALVLRQSALTRPGPCVIGRSRQWSGLHGTCANAPPSARFAASPPRNAPSPSSSPPVLTEDVPGVMRMVSATDLSPRRAVCCRSMLPSC